MKLPYVALSFTLCAALSAPLVVAMPVLTPAAHAAAAEENAPTITPTFAQRVELRRLITKDAEARALFGRFERTAKNALNDAPNPIPLIQTEGKLNQDPVKIATQASLRDMGKIQSLAWTAVLTGPEGPVTASNAYAAKAKEFLLAWADKNRSKGDPIDDTNLEPALMGYDLVRPAFSSDEQARMATWLHQVAAEEQRTGAQPRDTSKNNWNSHRLKIVGLIAFVLHDQSLIDWTVTGYKRQIEINLDPDGSSWDFHERDALHYHLYDLEPLLTLAIAARKNGIDLYDYASPSGASLPKSVAWTVPFCDGTQTHPEFVNSKVAFDRKRAESGDPHYKAGRLFEPKSALNMIGLAAAFDKPGEPRYATLEKTVAGKPDAHFLSWQDVLNAVESR